MSGKRKKRWRPRFSVRTLVVVVTLVCLYLAGRIPTERQGLDDVHRYVAARPGQNWPRNASTPFPLIVGIDDMTISANTSLRQFDVRRRYYFWFFGLVIPLPYDRFGSYP